MTRPVWYEDFLAYVPNPDIVEATTFFTPTGTPTASSGGLAPDLLSSVPTHYAIIDPNDSGTCSYAGDVAYNGGGFFVADDCAITVIVSGGGTGFEVTVCALPAPDSSSDIDYELVWIDSVSNPDVYYVKGGYYYCFRVSAPAFGNTVDWGVTTEVLGPPPEPTATLFFTNIGGATETL